MQSSNHENEVAVAFGSRPRETPLLFNSGRLSTITHPKKNRIWARSERSLFSERSILVRFHTPRLHHNDTSLIGCGIFPASTMPQSFVFRVAVNKSRVPSGRARWGVRAVPKCPPKAVRTTQRRTDPVYLSVPRLKR